MRTKDRRFLGWSQVGTWDDLNFERIENVECSVGKSKTIGDLEIVKYQANGAISNLQFDVLEADGASRFELLEKVIGRSNLA